MASGRIGTGPGAAVGGGSAAVARGSRRTRGTAVATRSSGWTRGTAAATHGSERMSGTRRRPALPLVILTLAVTGGASDGARGRCRG